MTSHSTASILLARETDLDHGLEHHHNPVPPEPHGEHLGAELQLDHDLLLEVIPDGDPGAREPGARPATHQSDVIASGK